MPDEVKTDEKVVETAKAENDVGEALKAQLEAAQAETAKLRETVDSLSKAAKVVTSNTKDVNEWKSATTVILRQAGYGSSDIDAYISEALAKAGASDEATQEPKDDGRGDELATLRQELSEVRGVQWKDRFNKALDTVLDTNRDAATILEVARKSKGPDEERKLREALREEIQDATLNALNVRAMKAKRVDQSWITEEATRVGEKLLRVHRAGIEAARSLGASNSESGPVDQVLSEKPVPRPTYNSKSRDGDLKADVTGYAVDYLSRLSMDDATGGNSKA